VSDLFIGLMSGTSLDGVDGVLCRFEPRLEVLAHQSLAFDPALREELLALNTPGAAQAGGGELHRAALAGNALARCYALGVHALLKATGTQPGQVRAIGAHGQTVRHQPGQFDGHGYTLQLNAPALLAELTGIDVVADLRSRDVAAGGQGAPLVPAFHAAAFGRGDASLAVLNIGGISNLSVLDPGHAVRGFDCGPGNGLMDHWCRLHTGQPFDAQGAWAAGGRVLPALLQAALADPFFSLPPPKSTGRDLFNAPWLDALLAAQPQAAPRDVQATLCELTAASIAADLRRHAPRASELIVCGGGALNTQLMRRLSVAADPVKVVSSTDRGLPPLQVEATAFAWLARAHVQRQPGNLASVTGALGPRILGALYPA
jgi:anhydro-N-acetylmuramic acid kinase